MPYQLWGCRGAHSRVCVGCCPHGGLAGLMRLLMLWVWLQDGKFRWTRFDNLLREGSKSQDFDASQLWLLAGWILSPNAAAVRSTLATELAKMLDAAAAADMRQRLARRWVRRLTGRGALWACAVRGVLWALSLVPEPL